jgi:MFS family permease
MPTPSISVPSRQLSPWALVILCAINHTALTGSRVAVSLQALALGVSPLEAGALLALYALVPTLCSMRIGRWVDRVGARRPAIAGMAVTCAGFAIPALQPDVVGLHLAAALVGSGYPVSLLALQSQLGGCSDPVQRRTGLSNFALATAVSSGLGPFIAGRSLAFGGPCLAFGLLAGLSLTAWLAAMLHRNGLVSLRSPRGAAPHGSTSSGRATDNDTMRRVLVADLLLSIGWNANGFIVPIHGSGRGWSAAIVGDLLATFGCAVWLIRALPATWRERVGDWRTICVALFIGGLGFGCYPYAPSLPCAFALQFALGLGLGSALPSVLSLLHAHTPAGRHGEALGLRVAMLNLSALGLPLWAGSALPSGWRPCSCPSAVRCASVRPC